ncbi:MAG: DUF5615 family PIN-like protein [Planctomycetes bacterium]|nr:DUF5615 family PIN-like protein [Planctomycetota bacterium]
MRFLLDMGIPPLSAEFLNRQEHEAVHLRDLGLRKKPDPDILRKARAENRILVTHDWTLAISWPPQEALCRALSPYPRQPLNVRAEALNDARVPL